MNAPMVSIIMPAYNARPYIREAVESILAQTYGNIELLICDDASTDGTAEIIQSFEDTRIRTFFNGTNLGNLKTSNFLFAQCTGAFIGIQDADDVSTPDRIELSMRAFADDPELGIIGTNYVLTDADGTERSCGLLPIVDSDIRKVMEKEVPPLLCATVVVRRSIVEQVGYYRPIFDRLGCADFDWIFRICEITKTANIKSPCYRYRKLQSSFSNNLNRKHLLVKYYNEIIVEAHKQRLSGERDFIDRQDLMAIRQFMSNSLLHRAEQAFWADDMTLTWNLLFEAFGLYPKNLNICRSGFYMFRTSLLNFFRQPLASGRIP